MDRSIDDDLLLQASQQYEALVGKHDDGQLRECDGVTCMSDDDGLDELLLQASQKYESTVTKIGDGQDELLQAKEVESDDFPDDLFLEVSQNYNLESNEQFDEITPAETGVQRQKSRFGNPTTNAEIESIRKSGVPVKTKMNTNWAINVWNSWAKERVCVEEAEKDHELCNNFVDMKVEAMVFWLPKFVIEVRKEDTTQYPPDSIYSLICGLQRCLKNNDRAEISIFSDSMFARFRQVLDAQMKQLRSTGKFNKVSADIVTEAMEDKLWELGLLGDHTPQALSDTLLFYIGMFFALRGGEEHRKLRHDPCQIVLHESTTGRSYLTYTEDTSKTNQGGLLQKDRVPKKVTHFANEECPKRCLVQIFKTYNSRCPPDRPAHALYLKPLKRPKGEVWFQKAAIGHNTLSKTVFRLMSSAKIPGCFSNHSLRSTSTTRLYNAHVDEQLIMLRTGHTSTKGVRCYKRTSEQLLEETSDILNKKSKLEPEQIETNGAVSTLSPQIGAPQIGLNIHC